MQYQHLTDEELIRALRLRTGLTDLERELLRRIETSARDLADRLLTLEYALAASKDELDDCYLDNDRLLDQVDRLQVQVNSLTHPHQKGN